MNPTKHWMMWRMTCLGHTCESDNAISIWSNLTNLIWHYDIEVQFIYLFIFFFRRSVYAGWLYMTIYGGFPGGSSGKESAAMRETWVQPLGQEDPLEKGMATPVFLPGEFHGQRRLARYSLWGRKMSDATEQLTYTHNYRCVYML